MRNVVFAAVVAVVSVFSTHAFAQQNVWVQIAAERSLALAQSTAQSYSSGLANVNGFVMNSGWYAISLGPFGRAQADDVLNRLRLGGQIPSDSYIAFSDSYRRQFWPLGATTLTAQPVAPDGAASSAATQADAAVTPLIPAEETLQDARRAERSLSREQRQNLQTALQWDGFYNAAIDGDFGPGTRNAMADWQYARNFDPTGVLSTKQRQLLIDGYQKAVASIGLDLMVDSTAGIKIDLPLAMVEFDRYEAPFVHFKPKGDSGVKVLLISQTGDANTMRGLFDIMQTLEVVPLDGPREINKRRFILSGTNDRVSSYTFVAHADGQVKGFTLIWPAGQDRSRRAVIQAMRASFTPLPDRVLPDNAGDDAAAQSLDLLAGLAIRRPDVSRSGFYIDNLGSVLTTTQAVGQCGRITLDDSQEMQLIAADQSSGLALLQPAQALAPISYARFLTAPPRLNGEIAVSGFSYGGILGAPTLTYGRLADLKGLAGEATISRLSLSPTESDAGGPVFDANGSVLGMLLPKAADGRSLPADVSFAAGTSGIVDFLTANGLAAVASDATALIAPEDLTLAAADMTVLVSCWN